MKFEIKVPSVGESVSEVTVARLVKNTGETVKEDEAILELETDKVNQVIYAPSSGTLQLLVKEGDQLKVGELIGIIDTEITPLLKKKEAFPNQGQISQAEKEEVLSERALKEKEKEQSKTGQEVISNRKRMSSLRATIAQKLLEAKNKTAMITTFNEVDMTFIIELRSKNQDLFQQKHGIKLGLMSFFVKATVEALKAFPQMHSYIDRNELVTFPNYDIGIAVSTEKGLVVPVIRNCSEASLANLEKQVHGMAEKARQGKILLQDLQGGSFTITNGGVFGSLFSTPLLTPPQSGILGMHTILKRPIVIEEQIVIRSMMYLALSYDHRVVDGKEAIQFLAHIKQTLESDSSFLSEF